MQRTANHERNENILDKLK